MEKIDLHIHSNISDGTLGILDIIKLAKQNNCQKIAITDHEKINDYSLIAKENNISIINGIEFNSSIQGMHILGYGFNNIDLIKTTTNNINIENEKVCFKLIENLYNDGYDITVEKVIDFILSSGLIYDNMDKKKIVKYLINRGYAKDVLDAYDSLIGRGQKFYIPIKKLTPNEIINLIDKSGGISVLAHPDTLNLKEKDLLILLKQLISYGLNGIEVINSNIKTSRIEFYKTIAKELNLVSTVGSDFHDPNKQNIGINIEEELFYEFEKCVEYKKQKV